MRPARPKYQVFISSTYADLREEREAVTWAILTARHIPVGMEAFTATDDRGWQTIKSVIDRSDYYVLILARTAQERTRGTACSYGGQARHSWHSWIGISFQSMGITTPLGP
jgi:hypothetical protein